jgi:hypothetical protein
MINPQGTFMPDQKPLQTGPLEVKSGLMPWLKQSTAQITPPQQAPRNDPGTQWYAEQLAAHQAQAVDPEIVKQMLLAKRLEQEAATRARNAPQPRNSGLFGKFGIDPISRKLGIEPEELGQGVGQAAYGITGI